MMPTTNREKGLKARGIVTTVPGAPLTNTVEVTKHRSSQLQRPLFLGLLGLAFVFMVWSPIGVLLPYFSRGPEPSTIAAASKERFGSLRGDKEEKKLRETCLDPDGPRPYVLISLGRSGSGSTWQVIGHLTGGETKSVEYTGSETRDSEIFFNKMNPGPDNDRWLLKHLCYMQLHHYKAGVVGFKWKPFEAIFSPSAKAGLQLMATLERPRIGVVRSRRNPLDVIISRAKHKTGKNLEAHCRGQHAKHCQKRMIKAGTGLTLRTKNLLESLRSITDREDRVDAMLEEMGVPHVNVSYERLYYSGDDVSEWTRIFDFLGIGPATNLTRAMLDGAMNHVATNVRSHRVGLANYDEVARLLDGTEFESLLH